MAKPRVLILLGAYWPGHEATGPNQSVRAMCEALRDEFDFSLLARDRAEGATTSLVTDHAWHDHGFARVRHLPIGRLGPRGLLGVLHETPHDVLYINSFFDRQFSIPPMVARRLRGDRRRAILVPRGEFSAGALGLNATRKRAYLSLAKATGLMRDIVFHATSEAEIADVRRVFPRNDVRMISNFRLIEPLPTRVPRDVGQALQLVFVGRISPVKGLDVALKALARVRCPIDFRVYGPVGDADHLVACRDLESRLPDHIRVAFNGAVPNSEIADVMASADLLFLPSRSENFGHSIFESLAAGTPVLIGEHTPWRKLEGQHAGFDLPLSDLDGLARAIERIATQDGDMQRVWRAGARAVAEHFVEANTARQDMRALLHEIAGDGS